MNSNKLPKLALVLGIFMTLIFVSACNKNKDKEAMADGAMAPTMADSTQGAKDQNSKLTAAELERQRLESRAKEIEEMINRIMSEDVYFEYDKAILTEKARELLAQVGDILVKEKQFVVEVEGHTDQRGTESYNMSLGGKRSQAVQKYLVSYGVEAARIGTVSYGEEKPKVEGNGEEAFSKNRRANFKVKVQ